MIKIVVTFLMLISATFALTAQDEGIYHVLGTEMSLMPFESTQETVAFTFVDIKKDKQYLFTPSLYYGIGYNFKGFQLEFTVSGSYLSKKYQLSFTDINTPLGYREESRERILIIDQVILNPRISVLGEVIKNLAIKTSFEIPVNIADNTKVNYINTKYWSNRSLSGDDYFLLPTPEVLNESIEYSSKWGEKIHIVASLGAEWRAFNWDFGYITHERPRTLSLYTLYSVHLSNSNRILEGTRIGNFITSGLKLTF